ncbi:hypothetical protein ACSBOB_02415 [Mesorhizobium sp. ASY16-5R]|uniref:hypothetical protein n=1 Tax=Mesorhizobium sp. ASY16-5R TaxID=3445772 RepID=UPI003F9FBBDA
MDWTAAIDKNREALKRVLAMLVAMAGLGARGQFPFFPQKDAAASRFSQAEKRKLSPALTLPRNLHRAIAKLLRPAEAAVRRLIIVAARGLVITLPPLRPRKPKPLRKLRRKTGRTSVATPAEADPPRPPSLPLLDPLRMPRRLSGWIGPAGRIARTVPRISSLDDYATLSPLPPPPSPHDLVSAERIALRLQALASALDDLPGQARRFARWRARSDAALARERKIGGAVAQDQRPRDAAAKTRQAGKPARFQRIWPLKPGRPPGWRPKSSHEVQDVLEVVHGLAQWALEKPNTS